MYHFLNDIRDNVRKGIKYISFVVFMCQIYSQGIEIDDNELAQNFLYILNSEHNFKNNQ